MHSHTQTHSAVTFLFCYTLTIHFTRQNVEKLNANGPTHRPITGQQLYAFRARGCGGGWLNYPIERTKYLMSCSCVEEEALLISEVRGQTGQTSLRPWKKQCLQLKNAITATLAAVYLYACTDTHLPTTFSSAQYCNKKHCLTQHMYTVMGLCNYNGCF